MTFDLRAALTLEQLEINLFRGRTPPRERGRIFGGQVIAQALMAAYGTVEDRLCHSLHGYFMRPGDPSVPIIFDVDRSRDGRSFATRRVVAIQHGQQIFNLAASFHVPEAGAEHQAPMPATGAPETYPQASELRAENVALMPDGQSAFYNYIPVEWRFVDPPIPAEDDPAPARQRAWFRLREPLSEDPRLHQAALAYCSDVALIGAAIRPHRRSHAARPQTASLDHAMWFHRPVDANQWHLYEMQSPSASGARGFNLGAIYSQAGALVANAAQEDLIRFAPDPPKGV